jgi:hypothetical protein
MTKKQRKTLKPGSIGNLIMAQRALNSALFKVAMSDDRGIFEVWAAYEGIARFLGEPPRPYSPYLTDSGTH